MSKEQNIKSPPLHVYGVTCSWNGPIDTIGLSEPEKGVERMPCCPHCKGPLLQMAEAEWKKSAEEHQRAGNTNYAVFLKWCMAQHRCYTSLMQAAIAFSRQTGKPIKLQ